MFVSTVGNFGWLDTPISLNVALIVFGVVIAFALIDEKKEKKCMNIKDVIVIEGTAIILCVFVTLALVNHTIMVILYGSEAASGTYEIREALYQIPYIGGVQGRYYLPICSLFFIPLHSPICVSIKKQNKLEKKLFTIYNKFKTKESKIIERRDFYEYKSCRKGFRSYRRN